MNNKSAYNKQSYFINLLNLKRKPSKRVEDNVAENRLLSLMKNLCPLKRHVEQFLVF